MAEIPPQSEDEQQRLTANYVSRLLGQLDPGSQKTVAWCALPHSFDRSIIERLKPPDVSTERILDQFSRYSFVDENDERYVYHESVRSLLRTRALSEDPAEFRAKHQVLAQYFLAMANEGGVGYWQAAGEELYHLLCSGEPTGIALLRSLYERAESTFSLGVCRRLLNLASEASPVSEEVLSWIRYYSARLALLTGEQSRASDALASLQSKIPAEPELRYRVLNLSGVAAGRLGNVRQAIEWHMAALRIAEDRGVTAEMIEDFYQLGRNYKRLGDFHAAELWHRRALALPETESTRSQRAAVLLDLGNVLTYTGRWHDAETALLGSRRLYQDVSRYGEMEATQRLGWLKRMTGKLDEANALHRSAIEFFEELGILFPLGAAIHSWANVLRDQRRWVDSRAAYSRALSIFDTLSSRRHAAIVSRDLAYVESTLNEPDLADRHIMEALATLKRIDDRGAYAEALLVQGMLALRMDDLVLAAIVLPAALAGSRETGNGELETRTLFAMSRLHLREGAYDSLETTGRVLITVAEAYRLRAALARAHLVLGEVSLHRDQIHETVQHLTTAIELAYSWNTYVGEELVELMRGSVGRSGGSAVNNRTLSQVFGGVLTWLNSQQSRTYAFPINVFQRLLEGA